MEILAQHKLHGGQQIRYRHAAESTQCDMIFSVYLPPLARSMRVPALYFLSGLTSTDENFSMKSGAQYWAAKYGIALIIPDTSPRGEGVPDDSAYDLGQGAGFYLNATQAPWHQHYHMYDYLTQELPSLAEKELPISDARSIAGHSMGGHGALQIALKNPERYAAVSAFAPIVNPSDTAWGQKAFTAYLGDNRAAWAQYDSLQLLTQAPAKLPIRIDQGTADEFYPNELQPERFVARARELGFEIHFCLHEGYGHSYYFINTFIAEHLAFHAHALRVS